MREERNDLRQVNITFLTPRITYGNATVATDNWNNDGGRQGQITEDLRNEGRGTDDVQGSDTEETRYHERTKGNQCSN